MLLCKAHTHIHTHTHTHTHARTHAHSHTHTHTHTIYLYKHIYTHSTTKYIAYHTDTHARTQAHTHTHTYKHTLVHTHTHTHTRTHTHAQHTRTHTRTHARTHVRTRTHTRTHARLQRRHTGGGVIHIVDDSARLALCVALQAVVLRLPFRPPRHPHMVIDADRFTRLPPHSSLAGLVAKSSILAGSRDEAGPLSRPCRQASFTRMLVCTWNSLVRVLNLAFSRTEFFGDCVVCVENEPRLVVHRRASQVFWVRYGLVLST